MSRANVITLLSDFGLRDTYVAQMKGVILSLNPAARLIDITHEVAPGAVLEGALALESAAPWFPPGTVHLAVVDPGVGSARTALAAAAGGHFFVGPDNGLFSLVLAADPSPRLFRLREELVGAPKKSATFHGRDLFAPAAALLALGRPLEELGEPLSECVRLSLPEPRPVPGGLEGEVIHIDRFGNCVTNLRPAHLEGRGVAGVAAGGWRGALRRTYADVAEGECLALWGSSGRLEVACRGGSAAQRLGLSVGDAVSLRMG